MHRFFKACWLRHCSVRREKQVQTKQECITLEEKILDKAHHRFDKNLESKGV